MLEKWFALKDLRIGLRRMSLLVRIKKRVAQGRGDPGGFYHIKEKVVIGPKVEEFETAHVSSVGLAEVDNHRAVVRMIARQEFSM